MGELRVHRHGTRVRPASGVEPRAATLPRVLHSRFRAVTAAATLCCVVMLVVSPPYAIAGAEPPPTDPLPAKRIVSLNPSLTSILVALGARDSLVGVDSFSARQEPAVAVLPQVGGLYDPSLEGIVALKPDLVVLVPSVEQRALRERLQTFGLTVLELDPHIIDDVLHTIEMLGARVGRDGAARARVTAIRTARERIAREAAERPAPRVVLVLQRDPLFVAGAGSFIDEMLRIAGARNIAAELDGAYPRASLEWLVAARPDVLLDASADPDPPDTFWSRWPSLPAVAHGRIVAVDPALVTLPGPRLDEAIEALAVAVRGTAAETSRRKDDPGSGAADNAPAMAPR